MFCVVWYQSGETENNHNNEVKINPNSIQLPVRDKKNFHSQRAVSVSTFSESMHIFRDVRVES